MPTVTITDDDVSLRPLRLFYVSLTVLGIAAFFLYGGIAQIAPTDELRALWDWYSFQPTGPELRDALLAIASVSVVVWTGGLIAFQIRGISVELGSALEYLRFAFVAPLFGLVGNGAILRTVALLFIVFYVRRVYVHFKVVRLMVKAVESHASNPTFDRMAVGIARRIFRIIGTTTVATLVACVLVFAYPSQAVTSWSSLLALVGGLQFVSTVLMKRKVTTP